ncbi:hypothetical protein [Gluconobacter kondonii]|uniref:hypothetical protein n=1 Tax=Gluconobacter kondonii TaxID=941463 RepID=UPI001B8BCFD4|nr:hypothetical protein [Gluconobacter kondonii]MBS1084412.1 hypothetical protein [Gluconobacter kondonii]
MNELIIHHRGQRYKKRIRGNDISNAIIWIALDIFNFPVSDFISEKRFNKYLKNIKILKLNPNTIIAPAAINDECSC